jgi:hypothetical protein
MMKNAIAAISMAIAFFSSSQVASTNASAPNFADGSVHVDTAGTGIKKWAIYRVENGSRQDPEIAKDFSTASGLSLGTYWVLGKKKTDAFGQFSLDTIVDISIAVDKDCDSLKVSFFSAMQMPDQQNPQQMLTCLSYSIQKANGPFIDKIYIQESGSSIQPYYGPSQGSCYPNISPSAKIYAVFKDANGCGVVGTNYVQYKPTNYPVMTVPGTEPGPIVNHVTIGVADCSGYYIHYNDVQYKICNSAAATGIVHLDSIVVSGRFVADCNSGGVACQIYHPFVGYFWLDSMRAIAPKPAAKNCWDSYKLDSAGYWTNIGTQPAMPADTIYAYQFDSTACAWKNIGLKDSSSLSISKIEIGAAFYPNPFSDRIEINIPAGSYGTLTSIEGKAVMSFEGSNALDTRSLEPGTYFIGISGGRKYQLVKY